MVEINNTSKRYIPIGKTKKLVETFLRSYKEKNWHISIAIVNDAVIRKLNKEYRQVNKVTDILSFRGEEFMGKHLGELIINIEEVRRVDHYADVFEKRPTLAYLFNFILIHGLLHLIGYDDRTESGRQKMLALGKAFLDKIET